VRKPSDAMSGVDDRQRQLLIRTEPDEGDSAPERARCGVGFDDQVMDRLFDSFYTTKNDGMGIDFPLVARSLPAIMGVSGLRQTRVRERRFHSQFLLHTTFDSLISITNQYQSTIDALK